MTVNSRPGHSSIPPKRTATGILPRALGRLEQNPQPNLFGKGPERDLFKALAPYVTTDAYNQKLSSSLV